MLDLQKTLDAARPGDVIELEPGEYVGNFKINTSGVTVRGAGTMPNRRIRPGDAVTRIVAPNSSPALLFGQGVEDWKFQFLEVTSQVYSNDVIRIGSLAEKDAGAQPRGIRFDRIDLHGHPTFGSKRGAQISGSDVTFENSSIWDFKAAGQDAMGLAVGNSIGNIKVLNTYLSGSAHGLLVGGSDYSIVDTLPRGIEVRGCHFFKPPEWQAAGYSVKNHLEFKVGADSVIEGNILENVWPKAQVGFAILLTAKPDARRADGTLYGEIDNILLRNNLIMNATHGVNMSAGSGVLGHIALENNLFLGEFGRLFQILGNIDGMRIRRNTAENVTNAFITTSAEGVACRNAVIQLNRAALGDYGVKGSGMNTEQTLAKYFPGAVFTDNLLMGQTANATNYPGNVFDETLSGYGADLDQLSVAIYNSLSGEFPPAPLPDPIPVPDPVPDMTDSQVIREILGIVRELRDR